MVHTTATPFTVYNFGIGVISGIGITYLLYIQRSTVTYRRFLWFLGSGFLIFSVGGSLADLLIPTWVHLVHGIAALLVVFGLYDPVHNDLRKEEWTQLVYEEPSEVRHPKQWIRPLDEQILELCYRTDLVLTPAIIAYNIDYSTKEVNRRLSVLEDHGFVTRVERGKYKITKVGEQYLQVSVPSSEQNHGLLGDITKQ